MPRSLLDDRVASTRVRQANEAAVDPKGRFVLYWMTSTRRTTYNFALDRAIDHATRLRKPLLLVETLGCGGRWASDRHHAFVVRGMADNRAACRAKTVEYYPLVESNPGDALDLVAALAGRACVVVTDDFPIRSFDADVAQVAQRVNVRLETVDSNGLLPMRATDRVFSTAASFRRFLQRMLPDHLVDFPAARPLSRLDLPRLRSVPADVRRRWPSTSPRTLSADPAALARLPIDHGIGQVPTLGGPTFARWTLKRFVQRKLASYPESRNHPDADGTSGLSPYLHFGHVSVHEIFRTLAKAEQWSPAVLADKATGMREGWWGMSAAAESFLDELVTWRELGLNLCRHSEDYDRYDSLPDWAKATLAEHAADRRRTVYSQEEFEQGRTHDRLWNAAQMQLVREGRMHNYMRMLWGKKILEWSASPRDALDVMIDLNNKYALDGQDPNSYSGIFWVLGRYDRPWGPERPVFGNVRYMSSDNTARKLDVGFYVDIHAPTREQPIDSGRAALRIRADRL